MSESPQAPDLAEEDVARAYCYALISRLFYAAPDADLLEVLAGVSGTADTDRAAMNSARDADELAQAGGYGFAFDALQHAARSTDLGSLRQEYDDTFIGAGKAPITPYLSGYSLPNAPDRHLVALRQQLSAWGLARREAVFEVEDHVSAVCDAMRWLIESNKPVDMQRAFFDDFVYTGVGPFAHAVAANASASFYRAAGALTRAFLEIEREGFALHAAG